MSRPFQFSAGLLSVGLLLAGCGDAPEQRSAAPADDYSDTIEVAEDYDPNAHFDWAYAAAASSWDPIKSINGGDMSFWEPVYDRLLMEDTDGTIQPMLATEFTPSDDGKALTLKLRDGLTFSDGTPFNADAVKFNLERARAEGSRISGDLYMVTAVNVVDDSTVELQLSGGIGSLPTALANTAGIMVSPTAAQAGTLEEKPVGIGPYVTTNIISGNQVDYEKSPSYWDPDAQRVATMTYYQMADDQTRINALKSGEVDGAGIRADQIDTAADGGFTPIVKPASLFLYLMLNTAEEPFDDPEVRKALNMSIDREAISEGLYEGYCTPQIQPFPETSPGYSEKVGDGLDIFPYDPDGAKKILEEAGVTEPVDMAISASNITIYTQFAEVVQEQLAQVGFNMEVHSLPPTPQVQEFAIDKVAATLVSMSTGINDPDVINQRYLAKDALFNPGMEEYPELAEYGAEAAASLDPAERKPAYEKYMDAWVENPPHQIPVCMVHNVSAFAENVSGVTQKANGIPSLRGVAVAQE